MKKTLVMLATFLMLPGMGFAATFTLDYNADAYTDNLSGTFDIGQDFGPIESADLSLYIAGRRVSYNTKGDGWYYDSDVTLNAAVVAPWTHEALSGDFTLYTFQLNDAALAALEDTGTFTFTLTGNSAFWSSDLSSWGGYTNSRFYLDYASLAITPAAVPLPATAWLLSGAFLSLLGLRRRRGC